MVASQSGSEYKESPVHVGNRIAIKNCYIGLSASLGRVLIRVDTPIKQLATYICIIKPLYSREMGCEWTVERVLREAPWDSKANKAPVKVTATVEYLDVDGRSYICKTPGGDLVRVHPSDIKEKIHALAEGRKLEMVLSSKSPGPVVENTLRVCCIASVICPGGLATTHIKLEPSPISIRSPCPEECPASKLLRDLYQAIGFPTLQTKLGRTLAEEIKQSAVYPKREIKGAPE